MGRKKIIVDNDSRNLIEFEGGGGGDEDGGWNWRREVRLVEGGEGERRSTEYSGGGDLGRVSNLCSQRG